MALTEEQLAQGRILAGIFMPGMKRELERVYPGETTHAKFAHYTSADTALKIIREKRLWMRNTTAMADYREVLHGRETLQRILHQKDRLKTLGTALEACRPGIAPEGIKLFDDHWLDIQFNTFVTSLSEHDTEKENDHGRLSMWRAFSPALPGWPWFFRCRSFLRQQKR